MKPFRLKFLCTACLAGALWLSPMHDGSDALAASAQQKAAQEKKRVEGQRANIEQKLQSLQAELDAREARSEEASQALKTADQAISQANRKLRDLREEKRGVEDELAKLRKIIDRELPDAAKETLLVLDATTGQNGLQQAKVFRETAGLTGIILTKLDGTAKGGICVAIAQELGVPVKYVGLGEGIDDLQPFNAEEYVKALI